MSENDRISGEQGSIKPEETLTDIARQVAFTRADGERGAMRAAANGALIRWLKEMEQSEVEDDREIVEFALGQNGFESVNEFVEAFMDSGEPVMAPRKKIDGLGIAEDVEFQLQEPEGDQDG